MEDLGHYIIVPINADGSLQLIPNLLTDQFFNTSLAGASTEKVLSGVKYLISQNPVEDVNENNTATLESGQPIIETNWNSDIEISRDLIYRCPDCLSNFKQYDQYLYHLKTHENQISLVCEKCKQSFNKLSLYQKHILTHKEEKLFNCTSCNTGFNLENNFKVHMALHGNNLACPICNLSFQRMASLKSHLAIHQVEEFHICSECSLEFDTIAGLRKHMKIHYQEVVTQPKELICSYCKKKFDTAAILKNHISSHMKVKKLVVNGQKSKRSPNINKEFKHKCNICNKTFLKYSLLERHIRIHSGEKPYMCTLCDKGFTQKGTLQIHMTKHSGVKPFSCTLCPAKFSQKGNLKVHVQKTHTASTESEKTFKCSECDCIFKKVASLNGHMTKIHATNSEEITITSVIQQLKNLGHQLCGTNTKSLSTVETTQTDDDNVQNGIQNTQSDVSKVYCLKQKFVGVNKVYICCFCEKETKKPSDLIRHLRTHTKERPFKCYCNSSFSLKSTLLSHLQTHKGKRGKKCSKCSGVFFSSKVFNSHREHCQKPSEDPNIANSETLTELSSNSLEDRTTEILVGSLKCQICSKTFTRKVNLKRHMQRHTGEKKHKCLACLKYFLTSDALKQHFKSYDALGTFDCDICDKKFVNGCSLKRHILTHYELKPYGCPSCDETFKSLKMCRKHIDSHQELDEQQEKSVTNPTITYTEQNTNVIQPSENIYPSTAILKLDSNGVIVDSFYTTDQQKSTPETSGLEIMRNIDNSRLIGTSSAMLQLGQNQETPSIYLDCPEINSGEGFTNYFFSQLKLQPNDTIVLNSENSLEQSPIVFNIQTIDRDTLSTEDMMEDPLFIQNPSEKSSPRCLISPPKTSLDKKTQKNSPNLELESNSLQNDISDNFLANNISLYPNLDICSENTTEINSIPINLINSEQPVDTSNTEESNTTNDMNLFTVCLTESPPVTNLQVISCLVCKKLFDSMTLYESHVCLKSILKQNNDVQTIKESIENRKDEQSTVPIDKEAEKLTKPKAKPAKKQFNCVYCSKQFTGRGAYMKHVKSHQKDEDKLHRCRFCDKQFKKPSDLSRHLRTHTGEKPFACDKCDKKFSLKSTLEGHYKTHDPSTTKDFVCEICNSFFSSKSSRKSHMLVHTGVKPYKCGYCDQRYRTVAHKKSHEQKIHQNRSKKIGEKKLKYITSIMASQVDMALNNAAINVQNSGQPENTDLTEIQLEFPDQTDPSLRLTESIQIDPALLQQLQNSNILLQDIDPEVLQASVNEMNQNVPQNSEKTESVEKIRTERNLECEVCHKKYASKDVLRKHIQLHVKNKFVCEQCNKWFPTIEALIAHEKLHSGYRPFACFLCANNFAELQHLKSHLKRIHQILDTNSPLILKMSMGESLNV